MNILLNFQALFSDTTNGVVKDLRPLSKYLEQQLEQYRAISFNYPTVFCYETLHTDLPVGREMVREGVILQNWALSLIVQSTRSSLAVLPLYLATTTPPRSLYRGITLL